MNAKSFRGPCIARLYVLGAMLMPVESGPHENKNALRLLSHERQDMVNLSPVSVVTDGVINPRLTVAIAFEDEVFRLRAMWPFLHLLELYCYEVGLVSWGLAPKMARVQPLSPALEDCVYRSIQREVIDLADEDDAASISPLRLEMKQETCAAWLTQAEKRRRAKAP